MKHDKHCVARAMISAIENMRDSDITETGQGMLDFAEDGTLGEWALYYLAEGMQPCKCRTASVPVQP